MIKEYVWYSEKHCEGCPFLQEDYNVGGMVHEHFCSLFDQAVIRDDKRLPECLEKNPKIVLEVKENRDTANNRTTDPITPA